MTGSRFHALGTLALSIVVFALSISTAVLGAHRDGLYADAGRADAAVSPETASGR